MLLSGSYSATRSYLNRAERAYVHALFVSNTGWQRWIASRLWFFFAPYRRPATSEVGRMLRIFTVADECAKFGRGLGKVVLG